MSDDDLFDLPERPLSPHPKLTSGEPICGVTIMKGQTEFICIKPPHASVYRSKRARNIWENNPGVDRHSFVNRWPNRPRQED